MLLARYANAITICCLLAGIAPARSEIPTSEQLDDIFMFKAAVFEQDDGSDNRGGDPDIDEDATIVEGIILVRKSVSERDVLSLELLGDSVSAASYDAAKENAELVSGATGTNVGRYSIAPGWGRRYDTWQFDLQVSYALEYAYRSSGLGGTFSTQLAEGSTSINGGFQIYDDTVRVIRFDGTKDPDQGRDTYTLNAGITQSLTPISAINFGISHTEQSGFLATSFNSVSIGALRGVERVPDDRRRDAISLRYKRALGQRSYELGTSYYEDNWGIEAVTLNASFFQPIAADYLLIPSYRYYTQKEADFYANDFSGSEAFRTSDPDLGDFNGQTFGVLLKVFNASIGESAGASYDIGFNYYQRSDDLNFYWLTFGLTSPL